MRTLKKNKRDFYYALFVEQNEIPDDYGNPSGEFSFVYSNPVKSEANISAARGETATMQFGDAKNYDRVMVLSNTETKINELSRLWVERMPVIEDDGSTNTPHDHNVMKVAASINVVAMAIKKVDVS